MTDLIPLLANSILSPSKHAPTASGGAAPGGNLLHQFGQLLNEQLTHVNNLQQAAAEVQTNYAAGGDIPLHNVMIASEKAELSLQLAMQIRNKLVSAYQEISHMAI